MRTRLLYLENVEIHEARCTVISHVVDGSDVGLVLDETPFFPKGGGQPCDIGQIEGEAGALRVERVLRAADGNIVHWGRMAQGDIDIGDVVTASIDSSFRSQTSRLHSAGEVICAAVHELGRRWAVTAASHIPGQSRVAFDTDLSESDLAVFTADLKARFELIVARNDHVRTMQNVADEVVKLLCPLEIVEHCDKGAGIRLVSPSPGFYRPCMGAHVARTGAIGEITFRKIRLKKGELSISYDLLKRPPLDG